MPALDAPSKPRRSGLWAPYIVVLLAFGAWSLFWLVLKSQTEDAIDREAANLRDAGYEVAWSSRTLGGYPFRLEVELKDVRLAEPSGWGLAASSLKAMAAAYQPDHWVLVAPSGVVLSRPAAGQVNVGAEVMRASLSDLREAPRFSFEGRGLTFAPRPGAEPFPFTSAKLVELHLRPADQDRAELFWQMQEAQTRRTGFFAQIAPLAPLTFRVAGVLSRRRDFQGASWRDAVRTWTGKGGQIQVDEMTASVGELAVSARGGPVSVGDDGRLRGSLDLSLKQGAGALAAAGAAQALDPVQAAAAASIALARPDASLRLDFEDGMTRVGPLRIAPAPRIY